MKEHGIIFKGELVKAIMDGRKTQTRRVPSSANTLEEGARISAAHWRRHDWDWDTAEVCAALRPEGNPGPHLMVRSRVDGLYDGGRYRLDPKWQPGDELSVRESFQIDDCIPNRGTPLYRADYGAKELKGEWKPSIHMPRWASRLTLRVKRVWPERVQEISDADARAEGVNAISTTARQGPKGTYYSAFADLWDEINQKRGWGWALNRPVWCIEFEEKEEG